MYLQDNEIDMLKLEINNCKRIKAEIDVNEEMEAFVLTEENAEILKNILISAEWTINNRDDDCGTADFLLLDNGMFDDGILIGLYESSVGSPNIGVNTTSRNFTGCGLG